MDRRENGISTICFSCDLDPEEAVRRLGAFVEALKVSRSLAAEGGRIWSVVFEGRPEACDLARERLSDALTIFRGDETPAETLMMLGIDRSLLSESVSRSMAYDEARLAFGRELARKGEYRSIRPVDRSGYGRYGMQGDGIAIRVAHGSARGLPPVMRARLWPDLPDREESLALFLEWSSELAASGLLDVLSIGASAAGAADGLSPRISPEEYSAIWRAARPMLVERAAGAENAESVARVLEERIDCAWHEHSMWWFSALDGKGRRSAREALRQRIAALRLVAATEKPFEPDVARHVAAAGGDDVSCVLSGLVAAKAAKASGIRRLVLHAPLGTSWRSWGINGLAKARAMLHLVRELEDGDFKVYLQPGADFLSSDTARARAQLAAAVAMMDDIEPHDSTSPQIIYVAGYTEGLAPADPSRAIESVRIARQALLDYRALREAGNVEDMSSNPLVLARASELLRDTRLAVEAIDSSIASPYDAEGLYEIMASGFFALPLLPAGREEFAAAVKWKTSSVGGAVAAVDESGARISARERFAQAADTAKSRAASGAD